METGSSVKYILLLVWFLTSFIASLLLFGRGLLLNRDVLPHRAKCIQNISGSCYRSVNSYFDLEKCLHSSNADIADQYCFLNEIKVVLIIIDALRYDFTLFDDSVTENSELPHENKLSVIHDLLKAYPNNARLYKFIADPPTTTMQRINGLTTGSLPTFIDVSSNFASSTINEDNIIDQLALNNAGIVFMGDDTWTKIYPNKFLRNYAFDSFNVWDLDTVDRGIKLNLFPELKNHDWKLLIAHFLGVDHCGHRYGLYHPEMGRKLIEMNDVLRDVVKELLSRQDTLLFVIGDHGMTSTGDHGGETESEITSALFVYSPFHELFDFDDALDVVRQVDLVPTLSNILGVAIPFSNTGSVILSCLPKPIVSSTVDVVLLLWRNVLQLTNFISEYSKRSDQFLSNELLELDRDYSDLMKYLLNAKDGTVRTAVERYRRYTTKISAMFQRAWVQFDRTSIAVGLCLSFLVLLCALLITLQFLPFQMFQRIFTVRHTIFCSLLPVLAASVSYLLYLSRLTGQFERGFYFFTAFFYILQLLGISIACRSFFINGIREIRTCLTMPILFIVLLYVLSTLTLFTNSYIILESYVILFLFVSSVSTLIISSRLISLPSPATMSNVAKNVAGGNIARYQLATAGSRNSSLQRNELYAVLFCAMAFFRLGTKYVKLENENGRIANDPETETATSDTGSGGTSYGKLQPYLEHSILSIILLNTYISVIKKLLRYNGNSLGSIVNMVVCSSVPKLGGILISVYWILECYCSVTDIGRYVFVDKIPLLVFICAVAAFFYLLYDPLCVRYDTNESGRENSILYHFIHLMKERESVTCADVLPFNRRGNATIFVALYGNLSLFMLIVFSVLLGQTYLPALIYMLSALWLLILLNTACRDQHVTSPVTVQSCNVSWKYVILWGLSCIYWFHGTGHDASFSGIQWNSIFVIQKHISDNMILPAILILFSTFSSYIIHAILLPLLLIFPFTINSFQPRLLPFWEPYTFISGCDELTLVEKSEVFYYTLYLLFMKYFLFFAIRLFAMMVSATIHCRHLMMWKIFAPKLIFEAVAFITGTVPFSIVSYIYVLSLTKQAERFISFQTRPNNVT